MKEVAAGLITAVDAFYSKHRRLTDRITSIRPEPAEWSCKEVLGHLVNSASNNQQRFLGLQFVDEMPFPPYQNFHLHWMGVEKFNKLKFSGLFMLWKQYNIYLAHVIANIAPGKLDNMLIMPDGRKIPLKGIAIDYVKHLKIHLGQFEETLAKVKK
jgi:hypothetical protein